MSTVKPADMELNEILSTNRLSDARRVVAQTTIHYAELVLWDQQGIKVPLIHKCEAARRIYRKIVSFSPWHELDNSETAAELEAYHRQEAYLSALAFRGCGLSDSQLIPRKPMSFQTLPSDIHLEEKAIISVLREIYGDESPVANDLA